MKIILIIMQNSISTKSTTIKQKLTAQLQHSKSQKFLSSGVEHHKKGNFEQAINIYKKAIEANPKNYGAFYNIGVIYKDKKMYQKSIQYFQKCVQIKSDYVSAYINLGNVCKRVKDVQLAQNYYFKAIQLDGSNNGVLNNLGLLYIQMSRFQEAQKIFKKLLENNPNSESAYNGLGVVQKRRKNYARAAQNWQKAIECNPKFIWPYYNLSLIKISQNKFEQAATHLEKANGIKNDDILILSTTAITLYKTNKLDEAFQILQQVKQTLGQQSPQQVSQKTGHNSKNIKWIQKTIKHLSKIQQLNNAKQRMSIDEQKQLKYINDVYFNSLIEDNHKQSNHVMQDMMKKIQLLGKQVQMHHDKINKIEDDVKQIKDDINKIKKEFQWDQKFDLLLQQSPEKADYYRSLYTVICTSIQTYRSLATGMLSKGEQMIRSKAGGFIDKITKILKLGSSLPTISHFCSILSKLGEIYLQKQSEHVQIQILSATGNLYNDKKLTKATSEAIIFLSKQSCFLKLLNGQKKQDKIWYEKAISKLQNIKQKIDVKQKQLFVKATQFGGHDISQQMNMAMGHCAEIFVMMIKNEHSKAIHEAQNPILGACQLWVKQMQKFKISILGGILKQGGLFSSAKGTYCLIKYGPVSYQTECNKRHENIIKWNTSQFSLQKKHNIEYIEFEIYDKSLLKKDVMIGCGRLYGNKVKKGIKQSIQIISDATVGFIQVCIL